MFIIALQCSTIVGICASEPIMLVMELAKLGPLNKYLRSHVSSVSIATISLFMYQVCEVSLSASMCLCLSVCHSLCQSYVYVSVFAPLCTCVCVCVCMMRMWPL